MARFSNFDITTKLHAQVDGKSSVACYLMALDRCYASLCEKFERQRRRAAGLANGAGGYP